MDVYNHVQVICFGIHMEMFLTQIIFQNSLIKVVRTILTQQTCLPVMIN